MREEEEEKRKLFHSSDRSIAVSSVVPLSAERNRPIWPPCILIGLKPKFSSIRWRIVRILNQLRGSAGDTNLASKLRGEPEDDKGRIAALVVVGGGPEGGGGLASLLRTDPRGGAEDGGGGLTSLLRTDPRRGAEDG